MTSLFKHKTESDVEFKFKGDLFPISVRYETEKPNTLELSDGKHINSPCLNCSDKPCMRFNDSSKSNAVDVVFSPDVCPTSAMFLDEKEQVLIDEQLCIGCGLCAYRCSTGAIYVFDKKMRVHRENSMLTEGVQEKKAIEIKNNLFSNIEIQYGILRDSVRKNKKSSYILTSLLKSCFMSLGFQVAKPRSGDVNLRMDLLVENKDTLFLVEVDDLGSPDTIRDIIDDIAVFSNKYDRDLSELAGISCLLEFPNKRSEYYELVTDVNNVLNLNIYSVSLAVMLSVLNKGLTLELTKFTINETQTSCRPALEQTLGELCSFSQKSSAIEAAK
ncbi:4Fe-4S binding protein [Vibrio vulnificus]|uniref:4Fe-4S binding protein n=1 Tax=Vibrio parahaemolyticus TaxID=670 RepID=UPI00235E9C28|nr:4Fe-4S binding protein [Vibrio parahaemolyticus]ELG9628840.1 4Fe-4S binding protein [Vibrio vulnificus]MDQ2215702.1 4Fe-4S binding protein [Vibrio parahaemolyticus]HCM1219246.1 4Fe-4S binding protein [Vibrio parahaemolyticus]HCM1221410.1 4Fe-4S binding protein [Vibrio parahaemolyticus]